LARLRHKGKWLEQARAMADGLTARRLVTQTAAHCTRRQTKSPRLTKMGPRVSTEFVRSTIKLRSHPFPNGSHGLRKTDLL
jgi:hypothetical protein